MTMIDGIQVVEQETPPDIVSLRTADKIILNPRLAEDWRIRSVVRDKIETAAEALPHGISFMIFEAFRPRSRQRALWQPVYNRIKKENPDWSVAQVYQQASNWVSPPDGFGSGHQAGAAVDISLAKNGVEQDMGTPMQSFGPMTKTDTPVTAQQRDNRDLLVTTLAAQSMVNYPAEWWHFSYGDRLWAEITGCDAAFFAPTE